MRLVEELELNFLFDDVDPNIFQFTEDFVVDKFEFDYKMLFTDRDPDIYPISLDVPQEFYYTGSSHYTGDRDIQGNWSLYLGDSVCFGVYGEADVRVHLMVWGLENGYDEGEIEFALRFPNIGISRQIYSNFFLAKVKERPDLMIAHYGMLGDRCHTQDVSISFSLSEAKHVDSLWSMDIHQLRRLLREVEYQVTDKSKIGLRIDRRRKGEIIDALKIYGNYREINWPRRCSDCGLPSARFNGMVVSRKVPGTCYKMHRIKKIRGPSAVSMKVRRSSRRIFQTKVARLNEENPSTRTS